MPAMPDAEFNFPCNISRPGGGVNQYYVRTKKYLACAVRGNLTGIPAVIALRSEKEKLR
jgi:hypothetical protein